ncbi:MAG TPA: hypothetical protein V6C81_13170 [Planktothrix sp.]
MNARNLVLSPHRQRSLMMQLFMLMALLVVAATAHSQEVTVLAGKTLTTGQPSTYAFGVEYLEQLTDHWDYSFRYDNDGHFNNHHRDGLALDGWWRQNVLTPNLFFQVGAGPYFYADTVESIDHDVHGVAADLDAALIYQTPWNLAVQLRFDDKEAFGHSLTTRQLELGFTYKLNETQSSLDRDWRSPFNGPTGEPRDSWSVLGGRTVVNIRTNGRAIGEEFEWRHELSSWVDVTVGAINEGKSDAAQRIGLAPELWLKREFYNGRLSMGVGTGVYAGHERLDVPNESPVNGAFVSGIVSATVSYRLFDHLSAQAIWHRPVTGNNSDSDMWFFGLKTDKPLFWQ